MPPYPNPLLPGFHPDPTIVRAEGSYFLVTSTLEYLPGLPVYRSDDLVSWTPIGNVATRPEQVELALVGAGMGVWAPTIRHRDGTFYVIVTIAGPRGCVLFTATDPAGPWSDGLPIEGISGIDPDLAWDEDGTAYVTYSGLDLSGGEIGHQGIRQVRVDLATGQANEAPRALWSGTGLQFPEAPHLYRRGEHWYLVIAEGGTERGHAVSVARGPSPEGPFEPHPANPILSARSTGRAVQNTGHADLVETPDGGSAFVLLGMRPLGAARAYSPLGRETFITPVTWADGWPVPDPVELAPGPGVEESFALDDPATLDDPGWIAVRDRPESFAAIADGRLVIEGGSSLESMWPHFVGRRQRHHRMTVSVRVETTAGAGGLACRSDEQHWFGLELRGRTVTATAHLAGVVQHWTTSAPADEVELRIETAVPEGLDALGVGADQVRLFAGDELLAELDGRYWAAEVCAPFSGRVVGMFASEGSVAFSQFRYHGSDALGTDERAIRRSGAHRHHHGEPSMTVPATNVTIRPVRAGDVTLEIAEAGVGGRPLLMVHGFTGAKEDFEDWFDSLAERGWHVVAPDLRGHGASDHPARTQDYSLELFESDLLALVHHLGWDRFVLVGHSMGGIIGQSLAIHQPVRLDGLVLMDTVTAPPGGSTMLVMRLALRLARWDVVARLLRRPPPKSPESVRRLYAERPGYPDWLRAKILATSPAMAKAMSAELQSGADRLPGLAALDLPVLVIVGEHDMPGFVENSQRMADAIPGATFALLDGAAHSPQLETPEAWWTALTGFLDGLGDA